MSSDEGGMFERKKKPSKALVVSGRASNEGAQIAKLGQVVALGRDVQTDAQTLLFFLATFGEGDKMGQFAFSSAELVGVGARTVKRAGTTEADDGFVTLDAIGKVQGLDLDGPRLQNAVTLLKSRGWAKTTDDGEPAPGTDFHEVTLTAEGRAAAQSYVKSRMAGGLESAFPPLFDSIAQGAPSTELNHFQAMLARARVAFAVNHDGEVGEEVTTISVGVIGDFTFDDEGNLLGVAAGK